MKRPANTVLVIGGILLIVLSGYSFYYWSTFVSVGATIDKITVTDINNGDTEDLLFIDYSVGGVDYESEYTLNPDAEIGSLEIYTRDDDPSSYQLAPSATQKNATVAIGLLGALIIYGSIPKRS